MKIVHTDTQLIKKDIEDFIYHHFWQSKKEVFETTGEPTPKNWQYYNIEIKIKKT